METIFELNDKKNAYENFFSLKYPSLDIIILSTNLATIVMFLYYYAPNRTLPLFL